jgi:hypothetical protein
MEQLRRRRKRRRRSLHREQMDRTRKVMSPQVPLLKTKLSSKPNRTRKYSDNSRSR